MLKYFRLLLLFWTLYLSYVFLSAGMNLDKTWYFSFPIMSASTRRRFPKCLATLTTKLCHIWQASKSGYLKCNVSIKTGSYRFFENPRQLTIKLLRQTWIKNVNRIRQPQWNRGDLNAWVEYCFNQTNNWFAPVLNTSQNGSRFYHILVV